MKELRDKTAQLAAINTRLKGLFDEAGSGDEMAIANIKSVPDPVAEIERLQKELAEVGAEVQRLTAIAKAETEAQAADEQLKALNTPKRPDLGEADKSEVDKPKIPAYRSLGHEFWNHELQKDYRKRGLTESGKAVFDIGLQQMLETAYLLQNPQTPAAVRALFTTSAGFDPLELVTPAIVEMPYGGPRMFLNYIPQVPVGTDQWEWSEMTTATEPTGTNPYITAEGAVYKETTIEFTRRTGTVSKVTVWVPATDEVAEDAPQSISSVNSRLVMWLAREIDEECVIDITGLTGSDHHTVSAGANSLAAALLAAIVEIQVGGNDYPNLIVMHPKDWLDFEVEMSQSGAFLWSRALEGRIAPSIWGMPIALDNAVSEGTAIVMATQGVEFRDRKAVTMWSAPRYRVASNLTQPTGQRMYAAEARFGFAITDKKNICIVTL